MQSVAPVSEVVDIIKEQGGDVFKACYQCGLCSGTCPWNLVKSFFPRRLIHQAQLGLIDFEGEEVWQCCACRLCVDRCPRGVELPTIMRALRRVVVEVGAGKVPDSLRIVSKNLSSLGNPLGEPAERRSDWAKGLGVKTFTPGTEVLYFPCCYQTYDPTMQKVARAAVSLLQRADVDFGILDGGGVCCGEAIRKAGSETLFQSLAESNIKAFKEAGVKKIVVTSPHCFHTFRDEYPEFGGKFEVVHFSQYLADLIKQGKIKFTRQVNKRVTYHDNCCLGRYSNIYDEPRQVLESIPGLELVEMRDKRNLAQCCGGCAGRLW
ncbi:MAG: (Fe-S)-binding protein, partial [Chloroflexota bacterium]|nr:(Fe-S)-binding protein [Chloroflexota bacterium]